MVNSGQLGECAIISDSSVDIYPKISIPLDKYFNTTNKNPFCYIFHSYSRIFHDG